MSNYLHLFGGTGLDRYADELDKINVLHGDGDITDDEMNELVSDIKHRIEMDEAVAQMQVTSDLLKVCDTLLKII